MAFNYLKSAFEVKGIPPTRKLVLLALANFADASDGTCYPGQRKIAATTGLNPATVFRHMRDLEEDGIISRQRGAPTRGGRQTDLTKILLDVKPPESR